MRNDKKVGGEAHSAACVESFAKSGGAIVDARCPVCNPMVSNLGGVRFTKEERAMLAYILKVDEAVLPTVECRIALASLDARYTSLSLATSQRLAAKIRAKLAKVVR
jgi:hypothetical protein